MEGILPLLRLDAVSAPVRRENHKRNPGLRQAFLARDKIGQYQNRGIALRRLPGRYGTLMRRQHLLDLTVGALISTVALEFIFKNHARHTDRLKKGGVASALRIPCRVKIANERRQLVFLPGVVVIIQRLYKRLVKFRRQLLPEDCSPEFLPQQSERRIGHTVLPHPAVFLMMVVPSSSDVKHDPGKILWHSVAARNYNLRIQVKQQRRGKHIVCMKFPSVCKRRRVFSLNLFQ